MELIFEKMDNLMLALIFYIAGAVIRTAYGFLAKITTTPTRELQFDVKYWATMIMSIIVSFMGAIGTFALVIPPGINVVAVFLMAFSSGYALNDAETPNGAIRYATKTTIPGSGLTLTGQFATKTYGLIKRII